MSDDCSICLYALVPGSPLLTLSCNHKFHLQCLSLNLKARNHQCPLCRATIDNTVIKMLTNVNTNMTQAQQQHFTRQHGSNAFENIRPDQRCIPSVEDPIDETAVQAISNRISLARQTSTLSDATTTAPLITVSTTLEFQGQFSHQVSNIYGLVTLKAPSISRLPGNASLSQTRVPIDIICVVDQSGSMGGSKMVLLKKTLIYIVEQLNELDRLAIVSFDRRAYDRSHGLKRMNQQSQEIMKRVINDDVQVGSGTYIGCGLEMALDLLSNRRTKNPLSALLLLTDGQDTRPHDYSQLMQRLPENTPCHTFGYGRDHETTLLVQLAEQGNGGTFTYIDKNEAVGPAFAATMGGLLTCVAQQICVNIECNGEYQVTHTHSKYKHEPETLPSSKVIFKLHDLNADESRNLLFQLHVPKVSQDEHQLAENHVIGHVTITYIESNSRNRITTSPVPFHLVRASSLSPNQLQINHTLDVQRNRIETAFVLNRAMRESNYQRSIDLLKAQVKKIEESVSANDPFCQQLIIDLQHRYPTERDYRLSQSNACLQHSSERSTYSTEHTPSVTLYESPYQRLEIDRYNNHYS